MLSCVDHGGRRFQLEAWGRSLPTQERPDLEVVTLETMRGSNHKRGDMCIRKVYPLGN